MLSGADAREIAHRVSDATKAPDAGVVVGVQEDNTGTRYVLWSIGTNGRITDHILDVAFTNEERLTAHAIGFIDNHLRAFAGVAA